MKFPGTIHMKVAMKYPRDQNEVIMKSPGIYMIITMKYPEHQNEIYNEILRHSYENCNETC
jgi:hypothetical protein